MSPKTTQHADLANKCVDHSAILVWGKTDKPASLDTLQQILSYANEAGEHALDCLMAHGGKEGSPQASLDVLASVNCIRTIIKQANFYLEKTKISLGVNYEHHRPTRP